MAEVAERDPLATRIRILEEFGKVLTKIARKPGLWRELSFETHEELREELGDDFIDYPEFEFWFSRFLQGNFELDYDRNSDPKSRSLTDLPLEVTKIVGEYLDIYERFQLRDVSKEIRAHVDNWDLKLAEITYNDADDWSVRQTYGSKPDWESSFEQNEDNIFSSNRCRNPNSFLMNVMKLPKLRVEELKICQQDEYWEKLIRELDRSNRKLHVKKVDFPYIYLSKIDLHFMIPGVLEEINFFIENPKREDFYEMMKSEQCQKAKMVRIKSITSAFEFPLGALYNCRRFTLNLYGPADGSKSEFLKNLMKYGVQKCELYLRGPSDFCDPSEIMKYFNHPKAMVPNCPSLRRYSIPRTNEFYELEFGEKIRLERKQWPGPARSICKPSKVVNITERDSLAVRKPILQRPKRLHTHIPGILEEYRKVQTEIDTNPELWRKFSFEAHKELYKQLGKDFIDYPEFEFWFSRFARGDFNLDYDRSSDPKAPSLTDLPFDIFEKVGGNLELHEKLLLRDVCKDFRAHVDNWDPKVTEISYSNPWDWRVWQTSRPEPYCARNFGRYENNRSSPAFYRDKMSFVMSVLAHPKLQLEKLTIDQQGVSCKKLTNKLDASKRKLHVKKVHITSSSLSPNIDLYYIIPGVLEEITVNLTGDEFYRIIRSEQYQAAKMVHIESRTATTYFPLTSLYDCPRFTLKLGGKPADALKAMFLKKLMKRAKVQECAIYAQREIMELFNEPEAMVPNIPTLRRYPIRKTNDFYELEYRENAVRLERKQ